MNNTKQVTMAHGAGGAVMGELIKQFVLKHLGNTPSGAEVGLEALDDAAVINDIVLKSDSHVVKPIFFPGGDIGRLSVSGTVNDISCLGAEPFALACGFVLEEGLALANFEKFSSASLIVWVLFVCAGYGKSPACSSFFNFSMRVFLSSSIVGMILILINL